MLSDVQLVRMYCNKTIGIDKLLSFSYFNIDNAEWQWNQRVYVAHHHYPIGRAVCQLVLRLTPLVLQSDPQEYDCLGFTITMQLQLYSQ